MRHISILLVAFYLLCTLPLAGQGPVPELGLLKANHLEAFVNARGELFSPDDDSPGLYVDLDNQIGVPLARGGGLWIIGRDSLGELAGAIHGYHTFLGNVPNDMVPGLPGLPALNNVWPVSCTDVALHNADFANDGMIDHPRANIFGWPGSGNGFFDATAPGLGPLPSSERGLAGFYDRDGSGVYDPDNGDYPSLDIRGCVTNIAPNQQLWTIAHDSTPHALSGLKPIGLELQTQAFAFRVQPAASILNRTIFVRYKLINRNPRVLDSVYVGLWTNFSLPGGPDNNYAGSAPAQQMFYGYVAPPSSGGPMPALGVTLLRGPLVYLPAQDSLAMAPISHLMTVDQLPAAGNALAFYNLLRGRFADGTPAPGNGIMFPDNPNVPGGNSEYALNTTPGPRHGLASYGPLRLYPGAVDELIVAWFVGHTPGATTLENVQQLYDSVGIIQAAFADCFGTLAVDCQPLVAAPEPSAPSAVRLYPNPAVSVCTVERPGVPFDRLEIFDVAGQRLRQITLSNPVDRFELPVATLPAGFYTVLLDGRHAAPITIVR